MVCAQNVTDVAIVTLNHILTSDLYCGSSIRARDVGVVYTSNILIEGKYQRLSNI